MRLIISCNMKLLCVVLVHQRLFSAIKGNQNSESDTVHKCKCHLSEPAQIVNTVNLSFCPVDRNNINSYVQSCPILSTRFLKPEEQSSPPETGSVNNTLRSVGKLSNEVHWIHWKTLIPMQSPEV